MKSQIIVPIPPKTVKMMPGSRIKNGMGMGMSLSWAEVLSYWSNWVLVCALVAGVIATYLIVVTGNIKEEALKRELARANERIAELNNETAQLRAKEALIVDSLLANSIAGKANALAGLSTRSVTEAIAVALGLAAPGTISEATRPFLIIAKLEPFAGKQFDAVVTSSDLELEALLLSLRHALKAAGWVEVSAREQSGAAHMPARGVRIDVDGSKDSTLLDAAEALASALNAEGIAATVNPKIEPDTTNAPAIHILIGPKP